MTIMKLLKPLKEEVLPNLPFFFDHHLFRNRGRRAAVVLPHRLFVIIIAITIDFNLIVVFIIIAQIRGLFTQAIELLLQNIALTIQHL